MSWNDDIGENPAADGHSEVEMLGNGPLEAPAKNFVPGPYYKSVDELDEHWANDEKESEESDLEEAGREKLPVDRRDFMRLFSTSAVFASTACVRRPEEKAIPYVNQPVDTVPGVPVHYASTCGDCSAGCGIVVKTREGRPVKLEGSTKHPISQGGSCALSQSTLQSLYHPERRKSPAIRIPGGATADASWSEFLEHLSDQLNGAKNIGILTGGSTGHRREFFGDFLETMGSKRSNVFTLEPNGLLSSQAAAYDIAFGRAMHPRIAFENASLIVGIGTDFLGVGVSHVSDAKGFSAFRKFEGGRRGRFIQHEALMTVTGGSADRRYVIPPGQETLATLALVDALRKNSGSKGSASERSEIDSVLGAHASAIASATDTLVLEADHFTKLAQSMLDEDSALIVGSSATADENGTALQLAAIMANTLLGAYGRVLMIDEAWHRPAVRWDDMKRFASDVAQLDALIIVDSNPMLALPPAWGFESKVEHIKTIVSVQAMPSETDEVASHIANGHHFLESWGDEQPLDGLWTIRQPAIRPAFNSKQAEDILMWVAAAANKPMGHANYRSYLVGRWRSIASSYRAGNAEMFFKKVQKTGFVQNSQKKRVRAMSGVASAFSFAPVSSGTKRFITPLDSRLHEGRGADRPVLHEVGDPMTTVTWDTWVAMAPSAAKSLGFKRNELIKINSAAGQINVSLYPLPGTHPDAIVVNRGARAPGLLKVASGFGVDPLPLLSARTDSTTGMPLASQSDVTVEGMKKFYALAAMQKHNDIANRSDIVKEISTSDAIKKEHTTKDVDHAPDLYPAVIKLGDHRWGLSVDLDSCSGCSACMVACAVENNIPQVGREQVLLGREMHWVRLDRYFKGSPDNPEVSFQPVMCQQCNHAPCEAVCPVFATLHDNDGLNAQIYNRCVGTRYCANACPYKVRRFNWFTHKWNVIGDRPIDRNPRALNPDVTVRTRGVMEKCTFCIQRIRQVEKDAKVEDRPIADGEIMTACQQACPSNAIAFGDLHDKKSVVANQRKNFRSYLMLNGDPEHHHYGIKTIPNVNYLAKISESAPDAGHHAAGKDKNHHG